MNFKITIINPVLWLLPSLFIIMSGCIHDKEEPAWYLEPGDALPSFIVTTTDGEKVSSEESYTREMEIVFFNTTCPDCREELPQIQKEYEENFRLPEDQRMLYICISREEGAADVTNYWAEAGLTLPVSAQPDRTLYSKFASIGIPRIFRARNGKITYSK